MEKELKTCTLSAAALHILAMLLMLSDHLWATVVSGNHWMTVIGRIAFPIFAFMMAEGYFHTRNLKKYFLRMLLFALISEIPFNLMYVGDIFYPLHQNVLFTLLFGLLMIHLNESARKKHKGLKHEVLFNIFTAVGSVLLGILLGALGFTDYGPVGVLTVLVFYFFRERKWYNLLLQIAVLWFFNAVLLQGQSFPLTLFGHTFYIVEQSFALLALIPIWLYQGRQGHHSKPFQYFCYAFYPCHMLILALLARLA